MPAKDIDCGLFILSIVLLLYSFESKCCYAINNITEFQPLSQGSTLVSPTQIFELGFFTPKKSSNRLYVGIWYTRLTPQRVVWVANRENPLRASVAEATLTIGSDGNLKILDGNNTIVWSTNVKPPSNSSVAVLLDNGNFILKDGKIDQVELWKSFDHPGDTLLPGSRIGFNVKTNERSVVSSWRSENDPSPGTFVLGVSEQIPPEVFIWINGSIPYWRSGPWDKYKFTGIWDMDTSYWGGFNLVEDLHEGTTYLNYKYSSYYDLELLSTSSKGALDHVDLIEDEGVWHTGWHAPASKCDVYGVCGHFSVCDDSMSPICECLKGFKPKSDSEWSEGNWTRGCERKKTLGRCSENTSTLPSINGTADKFENIRNVEPPDFYQLQKADDKLCPILCRANCSCVAYAFIQGIGCLLWSEYLIDIQKFSVGGENLFLRLSYEETNERDGGPNKKIMISLVVVLTCGVIGAIAIGFHRFRARKEDHADSARPYNGAKDFLQLSELHDPTELPIFDFNTILIATDNFSPTNKLGQGGFGPVYKGKLQDGRDVAVKRLSSSSGQGTKEFKNEMILISQVQHRNLVKLFGYCTEKEEKLLVYEFMPNKSLDYFIFDPIRGTLLNWASRLNIIHGIARGLLYLHRDSYIRVIHRDLKASNILLDEKMSPKISDFGLARIFKGTLDLTNTQRVVGTLGYMSPEYAMGGIFSEKSDVFSFGVLILEMVSGKKNTNFHYSDQHLSLIAHAWHLWSEEREREFVDEALAGSCSDSEVRRCIHIGLLCVQDQAADRPTMPDVVLMLINETNRPKPKQPMFTLSPKRDFQSQGDGKLSANDATTSLVEGR